MAQPITEYSLFNKNVILGTLFVTIVFVGIGILLWNRKSIPETGRSKVGEEIHQLELALQNYQTTHGRLPDVVGKISEEETHAAILLDLLGPTNKTGLTFIDIPKSRITGGCFLDPWGIPYHIVLGKSNSVNVGKIKVSRNWAIWSCGPNRTNEYGEGDDIASWKIEEVKEKLGSHPKGVLPKTRK